MKLWAMIVIGYIHTLIFLADDNNIRACVCASFFARHFFLSIRLRKVRMCFIRIFRCQLSPVCIICTHISHSMALVHIFENSQIPQHRTLLVCLCPVCMCAYLLLFSFFIILSSHSIANLSHFYSFIRSFVVFAQHLTLPSNTYTHSALCVRCIPIVLMRISTC